MSTPSNATFVERGEWLLGIGEPKPPSRFRLSALFAIGALLIIGALLSYALSRGRVGGPGYTTAASLVLWAWVLAENGGAYLYSRRGAWWGRGLRAFGWVAFLPLSMGFYLLSFWATSTFMFVTLSVLLGILVVGPAYRFASLAWQRE